MWFLYVCAGGVTFVALQYAFICARWYVPLVRDLLPIRVGQVWGRASCVFVLGREVFPGGVIEDRFERLLIRAFELSRHNRVPIVLCGGAHRRGERSNAAMARGWLFSNLGVSSSLVITPEECTRLFPVRPAFSTADEVMQISGLQAGTIVLVYEASQRPKVDFLLWAHGLTHACSHEPVKVHGGNVMHRTSMILFMLDPLNLVLRHVMRPLKIALCAWRDRKR